MLALLAKYKVAVIVVALLGALGIGGAGVAAANGVLPNPLSAMTGQDVSLASIASASAKHPGALRRLLTHGSVVTSVNGAWVTYTLDVGQVAKISDTSMTLTRLDGQQVTLTITPSTVWGNHRPTPQHPARLDGRRIVVFSQNGVAMQIGAGNGVLKNAIHLDLVLYRNGQNHEIQIDRGTAQSVSATQISVKRGWRCGVGAGRGQGALGAGAPPQDDSAEPGQRRREGGHRYVQWKRHRRPPACSGGVSELTAPQGANIQSRTDLAASLC